MDRDVHDDKQSIPVVGERAIWRTPVFTEFDIVTSTAITNCGTGSDGIICQQGIS